MNLGGVSCTHDLYSQCLLLELFFFDYSNCSKATFRIYRLGDQGPEHIYRFTDSRDV